MYHNDLYSKHNLNIGELGHITIQPGGELCECGKKGCLQTFASETWLVRKARLLYRTSSHTFLHQLAENEVATIAEQALKRKVPAAMQAAAVISFFMF